MTRNTIQREIVLDAVNSLQFHPTPEEIVEFVNKRYPNISRSTVYRNLNILEQSGVILRVRIPNAADRFDFNVTNHYHIVCEKCGRVDDLEMPYLDNLNSNIINSNGYSVNSHSIVFFGECPDCNKN